jgi:hypothetical protein
MTTRRELEWPLLQAARALVHPCQEVGCSNGEMAARNWSRRLMIVPPWLTARGGSEPHVASGPYTA